MRATITITGLVQGVGFRPFIYNLAQKCQLTGHVRNTSAGVYVEVFGPESAIKTFIKKISQSNPPAAEIHAVDFNIITNSTASQPKRFSIKESEQNKSRCALLPPDMDLCSECKEELLNPTNRRYLYPFINCTNCGPRYSIVNQLPYDRPYTSMAKFKLCSRCESEYNNPGDRRFHAQPNACTACGPKLYLLDSQGQVVNTPEPILQVQSLLTEGKIVAIKGVGGFHLSVNAENIGAVQKLRHRKDRPHKALAVMAKDIKTIRTFADLSDTEKETISSRQKPIVLLQKKDPFNLCNRLSQGTSTIGVMLPYTPLHHLLFHSKNKKNFKTLVMTSGNLSGEPMSITTKDAVKKLGSIADYYLTHNREIVNASDDSVLRVNNKHISFIRRSRSYAPAPISTDIDGGQMLAVGGALKNCICLTKGHNFFLSQHIGDLTNLETQSHFASVIEHLQKILHIRPQQVIHDLHPDYPSTSYAKNLNLPSLAVQHHHAHAVGCMAENKIKGPAIAIILDGTGFGTDNTIWGGEILVANYTKFTRAGHISTVAQPGGDMAVKEPWRMAISYLYEAYGQNFFELKHSLLQNKANKMPVIVQMIDKKINSPMTSSCGRLFDGVAALMGLRETITFEGQGAIALENISSSSHHEPYPYNLHENNGDWQVSFSKTITAIMEDLTRETSPANISAKFHATVIAAFTDASQKIANKFQIDKIVLSGGVFQNMIILNGLSDTLKGKGFNVFTNQKTPTNDGGLAFGQAVIGAHAWNG